MTKRFIWCEAPPEETGLPCACGATISGDDPFRGCCQAVNNRPKPEPYVRLVLTHKATGELI